MTAAAAVKIRPAGPLPFDPRQFHLPAHLEASAPPEARGLTRDAVRLLVARRSDGQLTHAHFAALPRLLEPGDVLVVNTSATLPASLDAEAGGQPAQLHLSGRLPGGLWVVELRHQLTGETRSHAAGAQHEVTADTRRAETGAVQPRTFDSPVASAPWLDAEPGTVVALPGGAGPSCACPPRPGLLAAPRSGSGWRPWICPQPLLPYLARYGRPIRYSYVPDAWPISSYQTVFAEVPGSAEMPSAARPFSAEVITRLVSRGVGIAPFVLHCGVSSPEQHEPPTAEWYRVPADHAPLRSTRPVRPAAGSSPSGTTAVRALESVADARRRGPSRRGLDRAGGRRRPTPSGPSTDCSPAGTSRGPPIWPCSRRSPEPSWSSRRPTRRRWRPGYLWHEFGDSHLILP